MGVRVAEADEDFDDDSGMVVVVNVDGTVVEVTSLVELLLSTVVVVNVDGTVVEVVSVVELLLSTLVETEELGPSVMVTVVDEVTVLLLSALVESEELVVLGTEEGIVETIGLSTKIARSVSSRNMEFPTVLLSWQNLLLSVLV